MLFAIFLKMDTRICFVFLLFAVSESYGQLRCYACTMTSNDADQSCLVVTSAMPSVDCDARYCTVTRQEFVDPSGVVASFSRGCNDNPDYLNHELTDAYYRTYFRACTSNLCNIGNGIQSITGMDPNPGSQNSGPNLLVPGTGASSVIRANSFMLILSFVLLLIRFSK